MERILIAEDNAPMCWLIERMLRGKYIVTVVGNGRDALEWLEAGNKCDMIITDLNMPYLGGLEVLRIVKQRQQYGTINFIIVSALDDQLNECLSAGADACLVKPFNCDELMKLIKTVFDRKQMSTVAA